MKYNWESEKLKNSLSSFERKCVYEELAEYVYNECQNLDGEVFSDFGIIQIFDYEVKFDFEYTPILNEYDEIEDEKIVVNINSVGDFSISKLLDEHNIKYEKSNASTSVYLQNNKIRISDHKRPPVVDGAAVYEWFFEKEIINENPIKLYNIVKKMIEDGLLK